MSFQDNARNKFSARALATAVVLLSSFAVSANAFAADDEWTATVGMPTKIDQFVIPGSKLVAKDLDRESPFVLRIVATYPHGTNFRYDLEYRGFEPGTYDLRDYLERVDNSSLDGIAPLEVQITPILPPGQIEPGTLQNQEPPSLGGYRLLLIVAGIIWALGLIALIFYGRKRRQAEIAEQAPVTLAERLRPMVEAAMSGELSAPQRAELERMLLAFWRKKLGIATEDPAIALRQLREHAEAGPLLQQLESWLYQPSQKDTVNINQLLEPYHNIPADEVIAEMNSDQQEQPAAP